MIGFSFFFSLFVVTAGSTDALEQRPESSRKCKYHINNGWCIRCSVIAHHVHCTIYDNFDVSDKLFRMFDILQSVRSLLSTILRCSPIFCDVFDHFRHVAMFSMLFSFPFFYFLSILFIHIQSYCVISHQIIQSKRAALLRTQMHIQNNEKYIIKKKRIIRITR